jgi:hypothetical protein
VDDKGASGPFDAPHIYLSAMPCHDLTNDKQSNAYSTNVCVRDTGCTKEALEEPWQV